MKSAPVLGLFKNEDELRDHLAANLGLIESGLTLVKTNFLVRTLQGANGTLDILAKDQYGCFVIIEVKRSDQAARQALHELSKYIAAFLTTEHVDEQKLRCFVVSTHWHELDTPLAFFRTAATVDVKGFHVSAPDGVVEAKERFLPPVDSLPKLCPDTRLLEAMPGTSMSSIADELKRASALIPSVRAALLQFEPVNGHTELAVLCLWRIADDDIDGLAAAIGPDYAEDGNHRYSGWTEESTVLDWLVSRCSEIKPGFAVMQMGTPEKITSILGKRPFKELVAIGAWPTNDLVHDLKEMQRCVVAQDISPSGRRANRYFFNAKSSPKIGPAWRYTSEAFLSFLGFSNFWRSEVERFLKSLSGTPDVIFHAQDMRHFQFRIYQHLHDDDAQLSRFQITVSNATGVITHQMNGAWAWDGTTFPTDELFLLKMTYGSIDESRMSLFSSTDERRYEIAYVAHGFHPWVMEVDSTGPSPTGLMIWCEPCPEDPDIDRGIEDFVGKNRAYCERIAKAYAGIPAAPDGSRTPVPIELWGD